MGGSALRQCTTLLSALSAAVGLACPSDLMGAMDAATSSPCVRCITSSRADLQAGSSSCGATKRVSRFLQAAGVRLQRHSVAATRARMLFTHAQSAERGNGPSSIIAIGRSSRRVRVRVRVSLHACVCACARACVHAACACSTVACKRGTVPLVLLCARLTDPQRAQHAEPYANPLGTGPSATAARWV